MNSESKPGPAGENSRRDFLQKIGTLAAASSVAANASAAQQQPPPGATGPGGGGRGGPWGDPLPVPGPLSKEPMPMVRFGKHMVSRLIIGSNAVAGLSHLSAMIDVEIRAWNTNERLTQNFKHCEELGINCMEDGAGRIPKYNEENGGKMLFTTRGSANENNTFGAGRSPAAIAKSGAAAIHHGGAGETGTDAWWRQGKLSKVRDWCKAMKDGGNTVAVTSHRPEVFDIIESENWDKDVDYYMCCLYKYGRTPAEWEKAYAFNPGLAPAEVIYWGKGSPNYGDGSLFVRGDPPEMLKVVKQTKKSCMVYKILASGRLCEEPSWVEAVFKDVFANIKSTDAVVVGMYDKHFDQFAINKEYVIKYGGTSIRAS